MPVVSPSVPAIGRATVSVIPRKNNCRFATNAIRVPSGEIASTARPVFENVRLGIVDESKFKDEAYATERVTQCIKLVNLQPDVAASPAQRRPSDAARRQHRTGVSRPSCALIRNAGEMSGNRCRRSGDIRHDRADAAGDRRQRLPVGSPRTTAAIVW